MGAGKGRNQNWRWRRNLIEKLTRDRDNGKGWKERPGNFCMEAREGLKLHVVESREALGLLS